MKFYFSKHRYFWSGINCIIYFYFKRWHWVLCEEKAVMGKLGVGRFWLLTSSRGPWLGLDWVCSRADEKGSTEDRFSKRRQGIGIECGMWREEDSLLNTRESIPNWLNHLLTVTQERSLLQKWKELNDILKIFSESGRILIL